ncbi:hypothetical protein PIB30_083170, partial [Stylosanthes scabra]|nr:hypothetical protein [Stylosanthes scabra]
VVGSKLRQSKKKKGGTSTNKTQSYWLRQSITKRSIDIVERKKSERAKGISWRMVSMEFIELYSSRTVDTRRRWGVLEDALIPIQPKLPECDSNETSLLPPIGFLMNFSQEFQAPNPERRRVYGNRLSSETQLRPYFNSNWACHKAVQDRFFRLVTSGANVTHSGKSRFQALTN